MIRWATSTGRSHGTGHIDETVEKIWQFMQRKNEREQGLPEKQEKSDLMGFGPVARHN